MSGSDNPISHSSSKLRRIRIQFVGGLDAKEMLSQALWVVSDLFEFILDNRNPDCVVFGPYSSPPPPGSYIRVGYFCENIRPHLQICDWAFGIPYEAEIKSDRYCRIEWHGIRPQQLVKDVDVMKKAPMPLKFCNFVYSNSVKFREGFFQALSQYKTVDAPGRSMRNRPSLEEENNDADKWVKKRRFLSQYKFTISFENCSTIGYNTEKLTDPMLAGSIPIYWGNPSIARHFNPQSFINAHDYLKVIHNPLTRILERWARAPHLQRDTPSRKLAAKFRKLCQILRMRLAFDWDFDALVRHIKEIDCDDTRYRRILTEPWVYNNAAPSSEKVRLHWSKIFEFRRAHASAR
jgi:hypothetical protein